MNPNADSNSTWAETNADSGPTDADTAAGAAYTGTAALASAADAAATLAAAATTAAFTTTTATAFLYYRVVRQTSSCAWLRSRLDCMPTNSSRGRIDAAGGRACGAPGRPGLCRSVLDCSDRDCENPKQTVTNRSNHGPLSFGSAMRDPIARLIFLIQQATAIPPKRHRL